MYLDTMNTRMLIESSSRNTDLPVNVIRYTSPAGTRQSTILRNTNYRLRDKYVVGENKLQIYIDDIMCCLGTEYNEIGTVGEESDIIQFINWDIPPERNFEYIIIGKDYLTISINGEPAAKVNNNIDLLVPTKTSDLVNNSGFITASATVARSLVADSTAGTLTIKKNGSIIQTFDGSANTIADITVPTSVSQLTGYDLLLQSTDNSIDNVRMMSTSAYDALDKSTVPNNTVFLVY